MPPGGDHHDDDQPAPSDDVPRANEDDAKNAKSVSK